MFDCQRRAAQGPRENLCVLPKLLGPTWVVIDDYDLALLDSADQYFVHIEWPNGMPFTGRGRRPAFDLQGPSWPRSKCRVIRHALIARAACTGVESRPRARHRTAP